MSKDRNIYNKIPIGESDPKEVEHQLICLMNSWKPDKKQLKDLKKLNCEAMKSTGRFNEVTGKEIKLIEPEDVLPTYFRPDDEQLDWEKEHRKTFGSKTLITFSKETLNIYEELLQKDEYKNLLKISQNYKPPFTNPTYCYSLTFIRPEDNNTDLTKFWKEYNELKNQSNDCNN